MEKSNKQEIKGNGNEQNITTVNNYYNIGLQREEVINIIKQYCYTDKEQLIDVIKDVMNSVNAANSQMPEKRVFVPIVQHLAYCLDDDYLKQTYKNLLKSSMTKDKMVHPSFVSILSQLNSDEIKLLNSLPPVAINYIPLINVRLKNGNQKGDGVLLIKNFSDVSYGVCEHPEKICLYLENLERLKLIEIPAMRTLLNKDIYNKLKNHPAVIKFINNSGGELPGITINYDEHYFSLTQFGIEFINACK